MSKKGRRLTIAERIIAGSLFLLIIIVNFTAGGFGYETFSKLNPEEKFKTIHDNPRRFKTGFWLIVIEHILLVGLAIALFVAFKRFNMALAVTWLVARIAEGLIQIYYKKDYYIFLDLSEQYSAADTTGKDSLVKTGLKILETKNKVFTYAQVLFAIGTLSYSVLFVAYDVLPLYIGWFGIAAAVIYGAGSGVKLKTGSQAVWNIGGLLILVYELVLGGWLVINTIITN
ncbi:MAG: DUF4386 domain-containing protein [Dehalococcoidales bacterium]|nr:MAG: DUF4386 domain-containing protein [Dehalococcoidales bacterium]